MSIKLMVACMQAKVGNPLRKLILLKLADIANDEGQCWPSYQHIANECETARSTVKKHIRDLEEAGIIEREYRRDGDKNHSNVFHLKLHGVGHQITGVGHQITGVGHQITGGGASDNRGGGASDNPRTSHSFEPVIEPVIEPKESPDGESVADEIKEVFDHWKKVLNHPRAILDKPRQSIIRARLKDFDKEILMDAIEGCRLSPYHMGQNEKGTVYDNIGLIFRNADFVEKFKKLLDDSYAKRGTNGK